MFGFCSSLKNLGVSTVDCEKIAPGAVNDKSRRLMQFLNFACDFAVNVSPHVRSIIF